MLDSTDQPLITDSMCDWCGGLTYCMYVNIMSRLNVCLFCGLEGLVSKDSDESYSDMKIEYERDIIRWYIHRWLFRMKATPETVGIAGM